MIRHIVMWRMNAEDAPGRAAQAQKVSETLRALKGVVPEIIDITVEPNVAYEGQNWDVVLVADFADLDLRPMFSALADETDAARGAALFHATLAAALADWLERHTAAGATVVAGGGCLQNQVLGRLLRNTLHARGLHLIEARRMPPNDGGLALGQAWIALQYLMRE